MSIQRFDVGPRMSQCVVHGNTVYTAGQVAQNARGGSARGGRLSIPSSLSHPSWRRVPRVF